MSDIKYHLAKCLTLSFSKACQRFAFFARRVCFFQTGLSLGFRLNFLVRLGGLGLSGALLSGALYAQEAPSALTTLTPKEVISVALTENLGLKAKRLDVDINADQLTVAKGEFRPVFSTSANWDSSNRALNQREFLGVGQAARIFDEETRSVEVGVGGKLALGTRYEISTRTTYIDNTYNRRNSSLFGPEYQSVTAVTVSQPLMRGFGKSANLAEVRLQDSAIYSAKYETTATINQLFGQVLTAIFENEFALENMRVKNDSIGLASNLLKENQRRVEEGMMSPIDVSQAQVRVAEANEEFLAAESFYSTRLQTLREVTGGVLAFGEKELEISGTGSLLPIPDVDRAVLAASMMENSPIYKAALQTAEAEDVRVKYARNLGYPQLDMQLSVGYNGLGGAFSDSYEDFEKRDEPDWGVGFVFSIPLERKTAKARVSVAEQRKMQALYELKNTEVQLLAALDNAINNLESSIQRRKLIGDAERFASEALVAEERRLDAGVTTSYNVLNQQRELSMVQTRALAAEVDIKKAVAQLYLIEGRLPQRLGFEITAD